MGQPRYVHEREVWQQARRDLPGALKSGLKNAPRAVFLTMQEELQNGTGAGILWAGYGLRQQHPAVVAIILTVVSDSYAFTYQAEREQPAPALHSSISWIF